MKVVLAGAFGNLGAEILKSNAIIISSEVQ